MEQPKYELTERERAYPALSALQQHVGGVIRTMAPGMDPVQFYNYAKAYFIRNADMLQKCNKFSVLYALADSAKLGLIVDGVLGEAFVLPYKGKATLVIGVKGYRKLAEAAGIHLHEGIVYSTDYWEIEEGSNAFIKHRPAPRTPESEVVAAYCVAKHPDGHKQHIWIWKQELDKYKQAAQFPGGPWTTHFDEMAKKTATRALCKRLPLGQNVARSVVREEYREAGVDVPDDDIEGVIMESDPVKEIKGQIEAIKEEAHV